MIENPPADAGDAGDMGLILGLGRSPGRGKGNPLKYSRLKNSMDRGAWQTTVHGGCKRVGHDLAHTCVMYMCAWSICHMMTLQLTRTRKQFK